MQTYQNLMSSGGYRPHLDSVDFIKFLRISVIIALLLSVAFSIRGNFLGLSQTLERNWFWLACIGAGITITSSILAMLTVIRIEGLSKVGRVFIAVVAIGIFYISTRLTLIGFGAGELEKLANMVREHPEVTEAKAELQDIIERQNVYGISHSEKMSLMQREKEQRAWIREIEKRLVTENRNKASKAEKAVGKEMVIARQMFAIAPDISIAILSPLLVLLFGAAGMSVNPGRKQDEFKQITEKILLIPENVVEQVKKDETVTVKEKSVQDIQAIIKDRDDGKEANSFNNSRAIINEQWNPFH